MWSKCISVYYVCKRISNKASSLTWIWCVYIKKNEARGWSRAASLAQRFLGNKDGLFLHIPPSVCLPATSCSLHSALLAECQTAVLLWNIHQLSRTEPAALLANINSWVTEPWGGVGVGGSTGSVLETWL